MARTTARVMVCYAHRLSTDNLPPLPRVPARFASRQVAVSQPHVERLFAAQANLELRIARSLSLGRWLWRGINFSELWAAAESGDGLGPAGVSGTGRGGTFGLVGPPESRGELAHGRGKGVWVPWETEAANASPECLKVSKWKMTARLYCRDKWKCSGFNEAVQTRI